MTTTAENTADRRNLWSPEETQLLGDLVMHGESRRKEIILSKDMTANSKQARKQAWISVAADFNIQANALDSGYSGWVRTYSQVRQKFASCRSAAKNSRNMAVAQTHETGGGRIGVSSPMQPFLLGVTPQELHGITDEMYGTLNLPSTTAPVGSCQPSESGSDATAVGGNSSAVIDVEKDDTAINETSTPSPSPAAFVEASNIRPTASASSSSQPGLTKPSNVKTRKDRPRLSTKRELETLEELTLREELTLSRLRKRKLALQIAIYEAKLKSLGEPIPISSSLAEDVLDELAAV